MLYKSLQLVLARQDALSLSFGGLDLVIDGKLWLPHFCVSELLRLKEIYGARTGFLVLFRRGDMFPGFILAQRYMFGR